MQSLQTLCSRRENPHQPYASLRFPVSFKNFTLFMRAASGKDQYRKNTPNTKAGSVCIFRRRPICADNDLCEALQPYVKSLNVPQLAFLLIGYRQSGLGSDSGRWLSPLITIIWNMLQHAVSAGSAASQKVILALDPCHAQAVPYRQSSCCSEVVLQSACTGHETSQCRDQRQRSATSVKMGVPSWACSLTNSHGAS